MTPEQEQFAIDITDAADHHQQWIEIVKFGLPGLMENQALLIDIIGREAEREIKQHQIIGRVYGEEVRKIFDKLGLKILLSK